MEQLIKFGDGGHAFITKADDDNCPKGGLHDFNGTLLTYLTRKGERRHINGKKYYLNDLPNDGRPKPTHWRMHIVAGESMCVKCGCPYTVAHNPYYLP